MSGERNTSLAPGSWFATRFEVVRRLGHGAFGAVYEARMHPMLRRVALKVLHADIVGHREVAIRFVREARILGELEHPHVVSVIDVGLDDGAPYIAMELLDGETLAARMKRDGPMTVHEALSLWLPLCSALGSVHARDVVHRDLKPENVMLARLATGRLHPKLLDFGIAKADAQDGVGTQTRAVMGTPRYMSPEQAVDSKNIDARSDQWSMAVLLWEMLAGRRLFVGPHQVAVLSAVLEAPIPDIRTLVSVPDGLAFALHRALQRPADARHADMAAFGRAVLPYADARTQTDWEAAFPTAAHEGPAPTLHACTPVPPHGVGLERTHAAAPPTSALHPPLVPETLQPASRAADQEHRRPVRAALLAAALVLLGGVCSQTSWRHAEATHEQTAGSPPSTFAVHLVVDPPTAHLVLDGSPVEPGPLHRAFPRDGRAHTLVITAPEFESQTLTFADAAPPSPVALRRMPPVAVAPAMPVHPSTGSSRATPQPRPRRRAPAPQEAPAGTTPSPPPPNNQRLF